jgi:nitrate/nitrite transporter NarK
MQPIGSVARQRFSLYSDSFWLAYFVAALLAGLETEAGQSLNPGSELPGPALLSAAIFSAAAICLGMGNGAVFQLM